MTTEQKAKAQQYFDSYPEDQVIHETSDGQIFLHSNHNDGVNHQKALITKNPDARMTSYYRKDLDSALAPEEETEEEDDNACVDGGTGDAAEAEFKALTPDDTWTKPNIVRWLNLHGEEANVNDKKDKLLEQVSAVQKKQSEAGAAQ